MKRLFKILGLFLLLLILLIVGGTGWMIGTERGFQQTLALAKKFAPGTLEWDEASGKLIGPLKISGLHYAQADVVDASVGKIDFDWSPKALLGLHLAVEQLHMDNVEVRLADAAEKQDEVSSSGELPSISLPISISLSDVAVSNIAIFLPGEDAGIAINSVALSAAMEKTDLQLAEFEITAPQGDMRLEGNVETRDDYPMELAISWQADIGQPESLIGSGTLVGSLAELQFNHQISGFATADIAASVSNVTSLPTWDATVEASVPNPQSLSATLIGTPQIALQSTGTPNDYQAQATVNVVTNETGPVTVDADVSGTTEMLNIQSFVARLRENGAGLSVTGQVAYASLLSDIEGQWQGLSWPVKGEPQFASNMGRFEFSGTPDDFAASLNTDVDGDSIPEGQWTVALSGSTTALDSFSLEAVTLDGTVNANGTASWEHQPEWDMLLTADGINPGKQWSEFAGSINLNISSTGQIIDEGVQLTADINQLSGRFRDQPLTGGGRILLSGEKLTVDNMGISHGNTQLSANGEVNEQIAVDFKLSSPDLSSLLPQLTGEIAIAGSVSGNKSEPELNARGNAENVAYADSRVGKLDFSIDAGLAANAVSSLSVDASDIAAAGQRMSDFSFTGQGTQSNHALQLSAVTDQGDLLTLLEGSFQDNTWTGSLTSLQLERTLAGDWRLREPVQITANAELANASQLCLDHTDELGTLCVAGDWLVDGETTATLSIGGLSPELASDYLPPGFLLDTELNGDATAILSKEGDLNAGVKLVINPGTLTLDSEVSPIKIGLEQTTIDASLQGTNATINLATAFTELGDLTLEASVVDPAGEGSLAGSLEADFPDLTLLSAFAPQIQQVSGSLVSNLFFGGTLQTPQIEGELALLDFSAEIPETAMLVKDTQLRVKGNPDGTLLINGESHSGEGQLQIGGNINPGTRALNLNIEGDQFEVANTGMMQVVISPELSIQMDDAGMQVKGKVTIPRAYINANGGNEGIKTVSASSDVVFVSEGEEDAQPPPSQVNLDVEIILGDSVEVEAGDFRGRLEGELRVEQTPELAPRGTGTITVLNGDYVIYGQQLNMERGRILFSGGPVDNPTLDMEVARTVQEYDVVAGARIQGTAQAPRLELYSEPPMPDASILSFILLGQPPGTTGGSYTLGKYLTPDLYVSYGIGLFDAINTFNMRYKLTDKLALEAASGSGSSADLIFTIEK